MLSPPHQSSFVFAACQATSQDLLKAELQRAHPELRLAFSRPGFLTLKAAQGFVPLSLELDSVFARVQGLCCGRLPTDAALEATADAIIESARALALAIRDTELEGKLHLHPWRRDPGDIAADVTPGDVGLEDLAAAAIARSDGLLEADPDPSAGDWVMDLIEMGPQDGAARWLGAHRHKRGRWAVPGGWPRVVQPPEAPSRAYLKIEEALQWSAAPLARGDIAVELGSAPGGACYALLERGLSVLGIDGGAMDERVTRYPTFQHIKRPAALVLPSELPRDVHWLLVDINAGPRIALSAARPFAVATQRSLCGIFLTLKLNEPRASAELPLLLERAQALGMVEVRATQLPSHRQEVLVFGLTALGRSRGLSIGARRL